jgi:hypothetical protein
MGVKMALIAVIRGGVWGGEAVFTGYSRERATEERVSPKEPQIKYYGRICLSTLKRKQKVLSIQTLAKVDEE